MPTSTSEFAAGFFFLAATNLSSSPRVANHSSRPPGRRGRSGRRPCGVLPLGVDLEADAAALQGDERFFELARVRTRRVISLAFDERGRRSGSKTASARPWSRSCVSHFLFGLDVVGLRSCF